MTGEVKQPKVKRRLLLVGVTHAVGLTLYLLRAVHVGTRLTCFQVANTTAGTRLPGVGPAPLRSSGWVDLGGSRALPSFAVHVCETE